MKLWEKFSVEAKAPNKVRLYGWTEKRRDGEDGKRLQFHLIPLYFKAVMRFGSASLCQPRDMYRWMHIAVCLAFAWQKSSLKDLRLLFTSMSTRAERETTESWQPKVEIMGAIHELGGNHLWKVARFPRDPSPPFRSLSASIPTSPNAVPFLKPRCLSQVQRTRWTWLR